MGSELTNKPRATGLTAVLDKGLGLRTMRDLVELGGPYIDDREVWLGYLRALSSPDADGQDCPLAGCGDCRVPRRNAIEIAWANARTEAFFAFAEEVGFTTIEVSDGTYDVPRRGRAP